MTKLFESVMNVILEQKLSTVSRKLDEIDEVTQLVKTGIFDVDPTVPKNWKDLNPDKIVANYSLWIWRIGKKHIEDKGLLFDPYLFYKLIRKEFEIPLQWHKYFSEKKVLSPDERNINNFKSIDELENVLGRFDQYTPESLPQTIESLDERAKHNDGTFDSFETDKWYIRIPHDFAQSTIFGERPDQKSAWCTQNSKQDFDSYYKKDYLWFLIEKKGEELIGDRWILHFENNEFRDSQGYRFSESPKRIRSIKQLFTEDPKLPRIIFDYVMENEPENIGYYYSHIYPYIPELDDPEKMDKDVIKKMLINSPFSVLEEFSEDTRMNPDTAFDLENLDHINVKILEALPDSDIADIILENPDIYETINLTYHYAYGDEPDYNIQLQQVKANPSRNIEFIHSPSDEMMELQAYENPQIVFDFLERDVLPSEDLIFRALEEIEGSKEEVQHYIKRILEIMEHHGVDESQVSYELMETFIAVDHKNILEIINMGIYPPEDLQLLQLIEFMNEREGSIKDSEDFIQRLHHEIKSLKIPQQKSVVESISPGWSEEQLQIYAVQRYPNLVESITKQEVELSPDVHRIQIRRLSERGEDIKPIYDYINSHYIDIFEKDVPEEIEKVYSEEISISNIQRLFGD